MPGACCRYPIQGADGRDKPSLDGVGAKLDALTLLWCGKRARALSLLTTGDMRSATQIVYRDLSGCPPGWLCREVQIIDQKAYERRRDSLLTEAATTLMAEGGSGVLAGAHTIPPGIKVPGCEPNCISVMSTLSTSGVHHNMLMLMTMRTVLQQLYVA